MDFLMEDVWGIFVKFEGSSNRKEKGPSYGLNDTLHAIDLLAEEDGHR